MYFRTKKVKNSSPLQPVEFCRNAEGQPRQRGIVSLGDTKLPDPEQTLLCQKLRIDWEAAFRPVKTFTKPLTIL